MPRTQQFRRQARHQAVAPRSSRPGTNPEQLFAAGWSACFEGALAVVAHIDAEVSLHLDKGEYFLTARLNIFIPGMERSVAQGLVDVAKGVGPYSKATSRQYCGGVQRRLTSAGKGLQMKSTLILAAAALTVAAPGRAPGDTGPRR
jgi:hypothetical protein